jgi:hypothetical protein
MNKKLINLLPPTLPSADQRFYFNGISFFLSSTNFLPTTADFVSVTNPPFQDNVITPSPHHPTIGTLREIARVDSYPHLPKKQNHKQSLSLLKAILLPLIEQISPSTTQINNLGTTITILLHLYAFSTIIGIGHAHSTADDTSSL